MNKNVFFIFSFLLFSYCGLEVPQPIPRLYSPNGVIVENSTNPNVPSSTVRVRWFGLNPESEFSGYNIYFTDSLTTAEAYRGRKIACRNNNSRQPTYPISPPFNVAREFDFDITIPYLNDFLFIDGRTYYFYVTAYNQIRNLESPPSRYASVVYRN